MPRIVSNNCCQKLFPMIWMTNTAFEMLPNFLEICVNGLTIENINWFICSAKISTRTFYSFSMHNNIVSKNCNTEENS